MDKNNNKIDVIQSIKTLIDIGIRQGISLDNIDNKIYANINRIKSNDYKTIKKKTRKKKKICRPALFISDSSDND